MHGYSRLEMEKLEQRCTSLQQKASAESMNGNVADSTAPHDGIQLACRAWSWWTVALKADRRLGMGLWAAGTKLSDQDLKLYLD